MTPRSVLASYRQVAVSTGATLLDGFSFVSLNAKAFEEINASASVK